MNIAYFIASILFSFFMLHPGDTNYFKDQNPNLSKVKVTVRAQEAYKHIARSTAAKLLDFHKAYALLQTIQSPLVKELFAAQVRNHVYHIDRALNGSAENLFALFTLEFAIEEPNLALLSSQALPTKANDEFEVLKSSLNQPCKEFIAQLNRICLDKYGRFKNIQTNKQREQLALAVSQYLKTILDKQTYLDKIHGYARDGIVGFEKIYRIETGKGRLGEKLLFYTVNPIRSLGKSQKKQQLFLENRFNSSVQEAINFCKAKKINEAKQILRTYKNIYEESVRKKSKSLKKDLENYQTLANVISEYASLSSTSRHDNLQPNIPTEAAPPVTLCEDALSENALKLLNIIKISPDHSKPLENFTEEQKLIHRELTRLMNEIAEIDVSSDNHCEHLFLTNLIDNIFAAYLYNRENNFKEFAKITNGLISESFYNQRANNNYDQYHTVRTRKYLEPEVQFAHRQTADIALLLFDSYMGSITRSAQAQKSVCLTNYRRFQECASRFPEISSERFKALGDRMFSPALDLYEPNAITRIAEIDSLLSKKQLLQFSLEGYQEQYPKLLDLQTESAYQADAAADANKPEAFDRYTARVKAISESDQHYSKVQLQTFQLSQQTRDLLSSQGKNYHDFLSVRGDASQVQLQTELVSIIEQTSALTFNRNIEDTKILINTMLDFTETAQCFNKVGQIETAFQIADLCWSILECAQAIGQGTLEGALAAGLYMYGHPIETAGYVVAGKYVGAYKLAQLLYKTSELGYLYYANPEQANKQWNQYLEPFRQVRKSLYNEQGKINIAEGLRVGSRTFTEIYLSAKLYNCLDNFYQNLNLKTLEYISKLQQSPPQHVLTTPDGMLLQMGKDATNGNLFKQSTLNKASKALQDEDPKKVLFDFSKQVSGESIIEFKVIKQMKDHIFSELHKKNGLNKLTKNENSLIKKIAKKIILMEKQGLITEKSNQIWTKINNTDITIRFFVFQKRILSLNAFLGHTPRPLGNTIKL